MKPVSGPCVDSYHLMDPGLLQAWQTQFKLHEVSENNALPPPSLSSLMEILIHCRSL